MPWPMPLPDRLICPFVNGRHGRWAKSGLPQPPLCRVYERRLTTRSPARPPRPAGNQPNCGAIADVFMGVKRNGSGEDDVILLGDLNVDEYHLGRLGQLPNIGHAITGVTTNTRHDKMYDNIVFGVIGKISAGGIQSCPGSVRDF